MLSASDSSAIPRAIDATQDQDIEEDTASLKAAIATHVPSKSDTQKLLSAHHCVQKSAAADKRATLLLDDNLPALKLFSDNRAD